MSGWYGTEAFEMLAQATTQLRFIEGPHWDAQQKALKERMEPHIVMLGLDMKNDEHQRRFDEAFASRQDELRRLPYAEYLLTAHWHQVRIGARARAREACQVCSAISRLHVHHRSYEHVGDEGPEDVIVLCADCHQVFHDCRSLAR